MKNFDQKIKTGTLGSNLVAASLALSAAMSLAACSPGFETAKSSCTGSSCNASSGGGGNGGSGNQI